MAQVPNVCSFGGEVISTPSDGWMIEATAEKTFVTPERDVEFVEIPGKDGSIAFDNGRFKNIKLPLDVIFLPQRQLGDMMAVRIFYGVLGRIAKKIGYQKLFLPYRTDAYRLAVYRGSSNGKPDPWYDSATVTLNFECKPFWYLLAGEEVYTVDSTSGTAVWLPDDTYSAKPLIRFYPLDSLPCSIFVGNDIIVYADNVNTNLYPYIDIDFEAMTISYNGQSLAQYVEVRKKDGSIGFSDLVDFIDPGDTEYIGVSQGCRAEIRTRAVSL